MMNALAEAVFWQQEAQVYARKAMAADIEKRASYQHWAAWAAYKARVCMMIAKIL